MAKVFVDVVVYRSSHNLSGALERMLASVSCRTTR